MADGDFHKPVEDLPEADLATLKLLASLIHVAQPIDPAADPKQYNSRHISLEELLALAFRTRAISFQVLGSAPGASEILALYPAVEPFTFAANFAGSKASVIANPTAVFVVTIARQVNGAGAFATIGTLSVAIDGTVTKATTGGVAIAIAAGDVIKATGDADGDTTFLGAFTLLGSK